VYNGKNVLKNTQNSVLKNIFLILIFVFMFVSQAFADGAERINAHLTYGNAEYDFTAYDVMGHKCFRLVDIAQMLSQSDSKFNIEKGLNGITSIKTGEDYNDNDGFKLDGKKYPNFEQRDIFIEVDGIIKTFTVYDIDGEFYFALSEFADALNIDLSWNKPESTLVVTDADGNTAAVISMPLSEDDEYDIVDGKPVIEEEEPTIDPKKPMVALTFDDGPNPGSTELILEALDKVGGHATFFVVGSRVDMYPDLVKQINLQGSQIGNHSYTHSDLTSLGSYGAGVEVNKTSNSVFAAAGVYPYIGRPPYGSVNQTVRSATSIDWFNWNVDTLDWLYRDSGYVYNYVVNNAKDGDVILMHDLHTTTGIAMQSAIPKLHEMGFQLVTIDEMAEAKGGRENLNGYIK
jgi:peptidoglycan/xylan/chitin deacetylase (PgdA/CDA1 family)